MPAFRTLFHIIFETRIKIMFQDGFLGYRTSFMLDFVECALIVIVPVLLYSL